MYEIVYIFKLDLAFKETKNLMSELNMPYPVIKSALTQKLTATLPEIPTEEEQNKLINMYKQAIKNTTLDKFEIENIHFAGIEKVIRIPDKNNKT